MKKLIWVSITVAMLGCDKEPFLRKEPLLKLDSEAAIMKADGRTDREWQSLIRQWTEWAYSQDGATGPLSDPDGSRQDDAQPNTGGVFLLAGGTSPDLIQRVVTIDGSRYSHVFIPLVVATVWYDACDPSFGPKGGQNPQAFFNDFIKEAFNGPRNLVLDWSGTELQATKPHELRAHSGVWTFDIHPSFNNGCTAATTTFFSDGYWALLPIEAGRTYTLKVGGDFNLKNYNGKEDYVFSNLVQYTLNVVP